MAGSKWLPLTLAGVAIAVPAAVLLWPRETRAAPSWPLGPDWDIYSDINLQVRDSRYAGLKSFCDPASVWSIYTAPSLTDFQVVLGAWDLVARNITYYEEIREHWQYPSETWALKRGDCEDSTFLLTSILRNHLTLVYAAIGILSATWGHAWCVARLMDTNFILETTLGQLPSQPWLSEVEAWPMYEPLCYFNDQVIWLRNDFLSVFRDLIAPAKGKRDALSHFWGRECLTSR